MHVVYFGGGSAGWLVWLTVWLSGFSWLVGCVDWLEVGGLIGRFLFLFSRFFSVLLFFLISFSILEYFFSKSFNYFIYIYIYFFFLRCVTSACLCILFQFLRIFSVSNFSFQLFFLLVLEGGSWGGA